MNLLCFAVYTHSRGVNSPKNQRWEILVQDLVTFLPWPPRAPSMATELHMARVTQLSLSRQRLALSELESIYKITLGFELPRSDRKRFFFLKINTPSEIFTLQTLAICQRLHFAEPTALEQEGVHKGLDGGVL